MTTDTRNGQTEVEILTRIGIPLVLGDRTWRVKPRTMKQDRAWLDSVKAKIVGIISGFDSVNSIPEIIAAFDDAGPDMLASIFEYDMTGQLDHEWIEENIYSKEATTAFTILLREAYPPFEVSLRLLPGDQVALVIGKLISWAIDAAVKGLELPQPTNSPSTNGDTEAPKSLTTA